MKFTKIPTDTFKQIQMNAGVLLSDFDPAKAECSDTALVGATSGGINFTATPTYSDMGEDIDNCPKNMMELKKLDSWDVKLTGNFVTVTAASAKRLVSAGDVDKTDTTKVTPRNDVLAEDFADLWFVGDYSNENGETNGGFVAIKMLNGLSTGGFKIQTADGGKGQFAFEFTGHYSIDAQDTPPFENYVKAGAAEA